MGFSSCFLSVFILTLIHFFHIITGECRNFGTRKKKEMKKAISALEIEKNKLASSPIVPELAKVESFLNNEKLLCMLEVTDYENYMIIYDVGNNINYSHIISNRELNYDKCNIDKYAIDEMTDGEDWIPY